jgi:hypothetical protein
MVLGGTERLTERMLAALETGVKGGKWYSLIDKVSSPANLKSAFTQVKRNRGSAGVDRVTIRMALLRGSGEGWGASVSEELEERLAPTPPTPHLRLSTICDIDLINGMINISPTSQTVPNPEPGKK